MRLIDGDALVYGLTEMIRHNTGEYKYGIVEARIAAMESPTVCGWISVKDRMPEDGRFVLVVNDDGKMMIAKYESEVLRWEYKYIAYDWDVWDDEEQGPICYWMALPEPPKAGESDA